MALNYKDGWPPGWPQHSRRPHPLLRPARSPRILPALSDAVALEKRLRSVHDMSELVDAIGTSATLQPRPPDGYRPNKSPRVLHALESPRLRPSASAVPPAPAAAAAMPSQSVAPAAAPSPAVACASSPRCGGEPSALTVDTFLMPRRIGIKRRMALLQAHGLDQHAAEQLCNTIEIKLRNGTRTDFWALKPNGVSLRNFVGCVNWIAVAADAQGAAGRRNPRGLALVRWANPQTQVASTFGDTPFSDDAGECVSREAALAAVRDAVGASRRARVHQLILIGGPGTGAALLRAIAAASGVGADDLLYASAAHIPQAKRPLWEAVYVGKFGFTRVPGLRANLDDPTDPDEFHEIPVVVRVGDLRALRYHLAPPNAVQRSEGHN